MPLRDRRIDWAAPRRVIRDVWLFVVTLLVLISVNESSDAGRDNRTAIRAVADVVAQIQTEREHNTLTACQRDNRQNKAIVGFVIATTGRSKYGKVLIRRARVTFPQSDCAAQVRERVKTSTSEKTP